MIDDSDVDRGLMMELLESSGLTAHGLPSPIGATREVRRVQANVVIIDQNMPVMDGSKLTKLFRENRSMQGVRVVLVSGNDTDEMRQMARAVQADAFVSKREVRTNLLPTVLGLLPKAG